MHQDECPIELHTRAPIPADLDALVRIDAQWSGRPRRSYLLQRLERALRPSAINLARVAQDQGQVVGFILGELDCGEFGRIDPTAWIDTIGVLRGQVRAGVGTLLIEDFVAHARAAGAERVRTLLDPGEEALTDFLEAQGFTLAPTRVVELAFAAPAARPR